MAEPNHPAPQYVLEVKRCTRCRVSATRRYWTARLPVRRWVFVGLWVNLGLDALLSIPRWIERVSG